MAITPEAFQAALQLIQRSTQLSRQSSTNAPAPRPSLRRRSNHSDDDDDSDSDLQSPPLRRARLENPVAPTGSLILNTVLAAIPQLGLSVFTLFSELTADTGNAGVDSNSSLDSSESRQWVCNQCGKTFAHRPSLSRHMRTHSVNAPEYACDVCGKTFGQIGNLNTHKRLQSATHLSHQPLSYDPEQLWCQTSQVYRMR